MANEPWLLEGLKVLDVASFIFGPACAATLADFGADVIKVESPGIGDPYRYVHMAEPFPRSELDYLFQQDNRTKRGIVLDLNNNDARQAFMKLVGWADVMVTNFPPRVLEDLKIRYEDIAHANDRLIYAQVTGYGEAGDDMNKPGYDATAYWARTGLMDGVRPKNGEPAVSLGGMGDHPSAMALTAGVMMALYRRERTGKGTKVSSNLMANGAWANACMIAGMLAGAPAFQGIDRAHPSNALINQYRTKDGRWILLVVLQEEKDFPRLMKAIGRPELVDDPLFADRPARRENAAALTAVLDEAFSGAMFQDIRAALDENLVTFGVMGLFSEVADDPQMRAAKVFVPVEGIEIGRGEIVDSPIWLRDADKVPARRAPRLGEHTEEVLKDLGFTDDKIAEMRKGGALG